jgi:hypothetical protein
MLQNMHVSSVCFQVFQVFQTYIASVSFVCCKSKFGCCICCYGYKCMFQVYVSFAFRRMFQVFYLDVSKVDLVEHMLQWSWWLATCRSRLLLLLERRRGSPCGCLRPADAFVARIRRRGQVTGIGPMCMRARERERAFRGRA